MHRKSWIVLAAVVILAFVAALMMRNRTQHSAESVKVGVILALSGPADFIGKPERSILEALGTQSEDKRHLGPKIEFQFQDSGGKVEQAIDIFQRLNRDTSIIAIIGPSTSGEAVALAREAETARIPLLTLAASRDIVMDEHGITRSWVFKFAQNDNLAAERLVRAMLQEGDTTVALLYSNDGFGKSGAAVFKEAVDSARSIRIVHEFAFQAALTQPEPIVARIPASAEAVLIWGTAPGPALLIKTLRTSRTPSQLYLSHGNASHEFVQTVGPASEGIILVGSRVLLNRNYLNAQDPADQTILLYNSFWQQHLTGAPSHFAGHARDAYWALNEVLKTGDATRANVRNGLEDLTNFHGVTGTFSFTPRDHAGLDSRAFETFVIRQGEFHPHGRD